MKGMIRSQKGEIVDMAALASKNSATVALGNARMNARGDIVDKGGKVLKAREVIVQEYYNSNPKAVAQTVSLRDLGDEVLTPAQAIEAIQRQVEAAKKPEHKKRKIVEDDEQ